MVLVFLISKHILRLKKKQRIKETLPAPQDLLQINTKKKKKIPQSRLVWTMTFTSKTFPGRYLSDCDSLN